MEAKEDIDSDEIVDLIGRGELMESSDEYEDVNDYVRKVIVKPFFSAYFFTQRQMRLLKTLSKRTGCVDLQLDATGSIVKTPKTRLFKPKGDKEKQTLLYTLIARTPSEKSMAFPVAELATTEGNFKSISDWLRDFLEQ